MRIDYDLESDSIYLKYSKNNVSSTKIENDLIMDLDNKGNIVGIEIIGVNKHFKDNNIILQTQKKELVYA